jgi:hypothetical protein
MESREVGLEERKWLWLVFRWLGVGSRRGGKGNIHSLSLDGVDVGPGWGLAWVGGWICSRAVGEGSPWGRGMSLRILGVRIPSLVLLGQGLWSYSTACMASLWSWSWSCTLFPSPCICPWASWACTRSLRPFSPRRSTGGPRRVRKSLSSCWALGMASVRRPGIYLDQRDHQKCRQTEGIRAHLGQRERGRG